jgi:hypothetical protein
LRERRDLERIEERWAAVQASLAERKKRRPASEKANALGSGGEEDGTSGEDGQHVYEKFI